MARTSSFPFSNTTENTSVTIHPEKLGVTSYTNITEDPGLYTSDNKSTTSAGKDILEYRSKQIASVNTSSNLVINNPSSVKKGIKYDVQLETVLTTTDDVDSSFIVEEPIVAYLSIRHPRSGNITNQHVTEVFKRLISACVREDGSFRFDDLMRMGVKPNED